MQELQTSTYEQLTGVFLVEASKGVPYHLFRVRPLEPLPEEGQKHGEVDGTGRVVHHVVQVVVADVLESDGMQLANESRLMIFIQHITARNPLGTGLTIDERRTWVTI